MNAGTLDIGNIVCDKLSVEMNAGTIGVKSASSSKDVLMDVSAGTIKIGYVPSFSVILAVKFLFCGYSTFIVSPS